MTVAGAGDGVAAIQIQVTFAIARVNPDTFATLGDDRHFLVSRQLILLFEQSDIFHFANRVHCLILICCRSELFVPELPAPVRCHRRIRYRKACPPRSGPSSFLVRDSPRTTPAGLLSRADSRAPASSLKECFACDHQNPRSVLAACPIPAHLRPAQWYPREYRFD